MTLAAHAYSSRKRPADGPLPPASPKKHARLTAHDNRIGVVAYVSSVLAPASPDLPMHSKPKPTAFPAQNVTPKISATPKSTPMASKATVSQPLPKPDEQALPTEPPRFIRTRRTTIGSDRPPPTLSANQPAPTLRPDVTDSNPSVLGASSSRHTSPSSNDYASDRATASSSSPKRPARPRSFHGSSFVHTTAWGAVESPKQSILNARNWKELPSSNEPTSSASSVASTSRVTLDSASSWRSTDSTTDRPSSSTSATSTGSFSETPQPRKEGFNALPQELFPKHAPRLCALPLATFTSHGTSTIPRNGFVESISPQATLFKASNTFMYTPKSDIHGSGWKYRSDFSRERSSKKSRSRLHIYQDRYPRDVKARHKVLWQTMKGYTPEWFARAKRRGYEGSEEDFTALADYTMRSMEAVRGAIKSDGEVKEDMDNHFARMQPALFYSVKKVLEGPKPKSIFTPGFDLLNKVIRAKDAAIDTLLRPPRPTLPTTLPPDDEKFVDETLHKNGFVSKVAREQVGDADIRRLKPGQWLNDEIINFYGALINARADAQKGDVARGKILKAFYLSTFFWTKLTNDGYEKGKLDRWTKKAKVDIFTKDIIIIPINHNQTHWTAAAINFQKKRFESYDSMNFAKDVVTDRLRMYVSAEHAKKKGKPFDFSGWTDYAPDDIPQQANGFDCGVFTCQFMESLSRGEDDFIFTQDDMKYIRRRMVWEIARANLRSD